MKCSVKLASDALTSFPYSETKTEMNEDVRTKDLTEELRAAAFISARTESADALRVTSVSVLIKVSKLVSAAT